MQILFWSFLLFFLWGISLFVFELIDWSSRLIVTIHVNSIECSHWSPWYQCYNSRWIKTLWKVIFFTFCDTFQNLSSSNPTHSVVFITMGHSPCILHLWPGIGQEGEEDLCTRVSHFAHTSYNVCGSDICHYICIYHSQIQFSLYKENQKKIERNFLYMPFSIFQF